MYWLSFSYHVQDLIELKSKVKFSYYVFEIASEHFDKLYIVLPQ